MSIHVIPFGNWALARCHCRGKWLAVWVVMLVIIAGCSKSGFLYPSYEELTQRGFYVYILPEREVKQRDWTQEIYIWSWDRHCRGIELNEVYNPLSIIYRGQEENLEFSIKIDPWDVVWDHSKPTQEVKLITPWAAGGVAIYYSLDYNNHSCISLKFKDRFEIPVQVYSCLPVTEVVSLVNQFEYIGPPPEVVTDPWDDSKCPK